MNFLSVSVLIIPNYKQEVCEKRIGGIGFLDELRRLDCMWRQLSVFIDSRLVCTMENVLSQHHYFIPHHSNPFYAWLFVNLGLNRHSSLFSFIYVCVWPYRRNLLSTYLLHRWPQRIITGLCLSIQILILWYFQFYNTIFSTPYDFFGQEFHKMLYEF